MLIDFSVETLRAKKHTFLCYGTTVALNLYYKLKANGSDRTIRCQRNFLTFKLVRHLKNGYQEWLQEVTYNKYVF